jgi:hypothetical protein
VTTGTAAEMADNGPPQSPRGTWLMYRLSNNGPITRAGLAHLLGITDSGLEQRLTELVNAGLVAVDGPAPAARQDSDAKPVAPTSGNGTRADASVTFTSTGEQAAAELRTARSTGIDRLVTEWQPDQAPELRRPCSRPPGTPDGTARTETAPTPVFGGLKDDLLTPLAESLEHVCRNIVEQRSAHDSADARPRPQPGMLVTCRLGR